MAGPPLLTALLLLLALGMAAADDGPQPDPALQSLCSGPGFFMRQQPEADERVPRPPLLPQFGRFPGMFQQVTPGTFRFSVRPEDRERCMTTPGLTTFLGGSDLSIVPIAPGETRLTTQQLEERFARHAVGMNTVISDPANFGRVFENARGFLGLAAMDSGAVQAALTHPSAGRPLRPGEIAGDQRPASPGNPPLIEIRDALPPASPEVASEPPSAWSRFTGWVSDTSAGVRDTVSETVSRAVNPVREPVADGLNRFGNWLGGIAAARGLPFSGELKGGVQLPQSGPGYQAVKDARWGTEAMIKLIQQAGTVVQGAGCPNFRVGDISAQFGGTLGRHKSHQNGLDADIYYIGGHGDGFNPRCNGVLGNALSTAQTEFIIVHPRRYEQMGGFRGKALQKADHWSHFHVRLRGR